MDPYVALDVSLKEISVCVLDANGSVVFEGRASSDPASLARLIRTKAPRAVKIGLETGATSVWLWHALRAEGLPVMCLDARHAHAALSIRPTKTDRSDARGLAEMVRMGWYREVRIKSRAAHERRALLAARHRLVTIRVELDGQIRGTLKTFGLIVGPGTSEAFIRRAEALAEGHPRLAPLLACLVEVRRHVAAQIGKLDRAIGRIVRTDATLRRFMSVPGVGPYLGLTPRRHQSGEVDRQGRICKCGDAFTRTCLYEAANVPLTKVQRWSPLKAWGVRLAKRIGARGQEGARCTRPQAGHRPALHLDGGHPLRMDKGDGDGLKPTSIARAPLSGGAVLAGTAGGDDREEPCCSVQLNQSRISSLLTRRHHTPDPMRQGYRI